MSRQRSLTGFMLLFYVVDIVRLYLEHTQSLHIDRLLTWVAPTILFIAIRERINPFDYLKLKSNAVKGIAVGLAAGIIQGALHVGFNYFYKGHVEFNLALDASVWWHVIITVGIVEEIAFRGLVLQGLWKSFRFWPANFASAFLFMVAHIPYWFYDTQFSMPASTIIYNFAYVFVFGLLEGYLLKRTNSLWSCIVHHSINNFLSSVIK